MKVFGLRLEKHRDEFKGESRKQVNNRAAKSTQAGWRERGSE